MAVGSVKPLSVPTPSRAHDWAYDPLFVVSGPKDHYKAAMLAKLSTAKFQICPIFANMFSDLPNHPRKQYVRRKSAPIPATIRAFQAKFQPDPSTLKPRKIDVIGVDRCKYFHLPKMQIGKNVVPELDLFRPTPRAKTPPPPKSEPKIKNKKVQTIFRESSVQTSPWEPSFVVTGDTTPELLKLDFLKWGSGLPPGVHEVQLLERARMKRAWEERCEVRNAEDLERRRNIIAAMERDEWAFREQEIQDIQDLRLKLLENMLNELHEKANNRNEAKLKMFAEMKYAEKEQKLKKLRDKTNRELRKLDLKHAGNNPKYHEINVVEEHISHATEIYAPMMRHGEHPKRWHLVIDEAIARFKAQFVGVEDFNTLPTWLNKATKIKDCACLKMKGTRLCMRETKWTAPVLKKLHEELLALRKHALQPCSLIRRIESPLSVLSTPEVEGISDTDEDFYQAMVLIQSIIKGRAAQMHIYEGRERCRELIQELKYSSGLLEEENAEIHDYKLKIKQQQRDEQIAAEKHLRLREYLDELQATVVGSLLDFLNKELRRLLEERRAHAICILLERVRYDREAAEAGRRQLELRRRREHDEMFKQIVKIQQETVDVYLEDILREGMEFASNEEAKEYVQAMAKKIDDEAYRMKEQMHLHIDDEEETVADLIHHFVVPEVQKQIIRNRIQMRQREKLKTVHDVVYSEIEDVQVIRPVEQPSVIKQPSLSEEMIEEEIEEREIKPIGITASRRFQRPLEQIVEEMEGADIGETRESKLSTDLQSEEREIDQARTSKRSTDSRPRSRKSDDIRQDIRIDTYDEGERRISRQRTESRGYSSGSDAQITGTDEGTERRRTSKRRTGSRVQSSESESPEERTEETERRRSSKRRTDPRIKPRSDDEVEDADERRSSRRRTDSRTRTGRSQDQNMTEEGRPDERRSSRRRTDSRSGRSDDQNIEGDDERRTSRRRTNESYDRTRRTTDENQTSRRLQPKDEATIEMTRQSITTDDEEPILAIEQLTTGRRNTPEVNEEIVEEHRSGKRHTDTHPRFSSAEEVELSGAHKTRVRSRELEPQPRDSKDLDQAETPEITDESGPKRRTRVSRFED